MTAPSYYTGLRPRQKYEVRRRRVSTAHLIPPAGVVAYVFTIPAGKGTKS